jgi:ComF family protein
MPSLFEAMKDLLFPPHCLGCKRRLDSSLPPLFCSDCGAGLTFIHSPCCPCCGIPFISGADHLCGDCLTGQHAFDLARSLLYYRPPASDLIRSLKFSGNLSGIATFRALITHANLLEAFADPDIILPVPLHARRLRERGFNQALVIAKGCLPDWKDKIETGLLLRHRLTTPQSLLSGKERRSNLKNVFYLADPGRVAGAKVLLVDDVYTTGSTVNECSRILRGAGAERIEVITLARSLTC